VVLSLAEIRQQIDRAMAADRHRLRQQLRAVENGKPFDRSLARLNEQLERSIALRDQRYQDVPSLTFDPELPITGRIDEITAPSASIR
jgi:ATP-dependent helicase HrpA